jgi:hypothetical protein
MGYYALKIEGWAENPSQIFRKISGLGASIKDVSAAIAAANWL